MALQTRNVDVIASKSFEFMTKLVRDVGNLLILIVLSVIPIVNFMVLGYFARVVRSDPEDPPKVGDYSGLFVEGLKLVAIVLVYAIILAIVALVVGGPALIGAALVGWGLESLVAATSLAVAIAIVFFAVMFFALPALGIYMRTGDFSKAFAFGEAWSLVQSFGVGNYVLLYLLLVIISLIAFSLGSLIPWVGRTIAGLFAMAFASKALSLLVNTKYPPAAPAQQL